MDSDAHTPERPEADTGAPPDKARKPLTPRRLRRKVWRGFLFALAALLIAVFVFTRTGVTKSLVLPRLEAALGAEVEAGSIVITPDLSVLLRDVRVRVRETPGTEGEVFTADRLLVELNWGALTSPEAVRSVELESPLLRISQDAATGSINATRLGIFGAEKTGGGVAIPTVIVRNGRVELGEHGRPDDAGTPYAVLADFPISGVLAPQADGSDAGTQRSFFSLTRRAGESGLEVTGYIDPKGVTCTLGGVNLDDWPASSIPTRFRDIWTRLRLEGRIVPRTIAISADRGAEITVDLESVALTLPFTAEDARSDEPARLTDVTGRLFVSDNRISADLTGRAGPLEQAVQFDLFGFDPRTSPFVARLVTPRLRWERDIALLDHVPPDVIEQTERFGRPEADVEAVIWLARKLPAIPESNNGLLARFVYPDDLEPDPEDPDAVRLSGALAMRRGSAAFRGFPYTFNDLAVDFLFNTKRMLVENIDGTSPSGARLTGGGTIAPLGPTSAVDLDLAVTDLAIDDALLSALNPARRELVDVLFNTREYAELVNEGLIRTPDQAAPQLARLAAIEAERAAWAAAPGIGAVERDRLTEEEARIRADLDHAPVFALGGSADVEMRFIRQEGVESIWTRDIRLHFPRVGFLTEMFPLPAVGEDVRVTIGEDQLHLIVDKGEAIAGGEVTIDAVMDTSDAAKAASPDGDTLPTVRVETRGIPIGPLLIRAVAGPDADETADPDGSRDMGPVRLASLFKSLGLDGSVDATADIVPTVRDNRSALNYTIRSELNGLTADIAEARTTMRNGSGLATATRDTVSFEITGDLTANESGARADGAVIAATLRLPEGADWGALRSQEQNTAEEPGPGNDSPVRPTIDAVVRLPSADLGIPAGPLVGIFDQNAEAKLAELRARHDPAGSLGIETTIRGRLGPDFGRTADIRVALTDIDRIDFDYQGLRLSASRGDGVATVMLEGQPRVVFDAFAVDLETVGTSGADAGVRTPAGRLGVLEPVRIGEAFATTPLAITLKDGRFESPLTRQSIERLPTLVALTETYAPVGRFDLDLERDEAGIYSGRARPRTATIRTPRGVLVFPEAEGTIAFAGKGGAFEGVRLRSTEPENRAELAFDGDWSITDSGTDIRLRIDATSAGLSQALLGLAPQTIGEIFDTLELDVPGATEVEGLDLSMRAVPGGLFADVNAKGTARFADASLAIGVPVTELRGEVVFEADRPDPTRPAQFSLAVRADRARLKGLRITNARATVLSGTDPGSVLVPDFDADAHGGRMTASVRISPPEGGAPDGVRGYWTDLHLAEVRIAPLLEDIKIEPDRTLADEVRDDIAQTTDPDIAAEIESVIWDQSADRSRGLLSASLSLSGTVGTPMGRRGRGRLIAGGGPVVQLPLLTRLIEVSNLQIPIGEDLGLAYANLLLDGDRVVFEDFAVLSGRVELLGAGDLTLPGGELDLRVRSRALNRVPVLTDVVESLRDELISTRIGGTIADPEITPVTFEETRRVLGSLVGAGPGDRLRSIGASDAGVRQRIREAGALLQRSGRGQAAPTREGGNDVP